MDKNTAEIIRIGLSTGFYNIDEIETWSDLCISNGNEDFLFSELSSIHNINEMITLLKNVQGNIEIEELSRKYFSILLDFLNIHNNSIKIVIQTLYQILQEYQDYLGKEILNTIYYLTDAYDLSIQGINVSEEEVCTQLKKFFKSYYLKIK